MKTEIVKLTQIKVNGANPRIITDEKFDKLINSILVLPKMLELRPIVVDDTFVALGGNMRYRALAAIETMSIDELAQRLSGLRDYNKKTEAERQSLIAYWDGWKANPTAPIIKASELSEDERREFIIKDNVGYGDWDMDALDNEWDSQDLYDWGFDAWQCDDDVEETRNQTETARLSNLEFSGMYYEPKELPNLTLKDCVNLDKYNAKLSVIEESEMTQEQKEMMKFFAYRFIKINFEAVANYYAFNATEEEQAVIERLRMVLVDGSINGFIEDDLIRIREDVMNTDTDWQDNIISGYKYDK